MSEQRNFLIDNSYKSIELRKILKLIFKKKKKMRGECNNHISWDKGDMNTNALTRKEENLNQRQKSC